jgi:probable phosphoglycerate mutase
MRDLILVRHGESEHHLSGDPGGWSLARLTDRGRAQAGLTATYLREHSLFAPSAIIASDLPRASETASIIAAVLGLQVETTSALRELNNGIAAGLTKQEAERVRQPLSEPALDWVPYPEGESWRAMFARISAFLATLRDAGRDRLLLVSHANAMICMINWFLHLDSDDHLRYLMYELRECSITVLRVAADHSRTVLRLNDVEHLAALSREVGC